MSANKIKSLINLFYYKNQNGKDIILYTNHRSKLLIYIILVYHIVFQLINYISLVTFSIICLKMLWVKFNKIIVCFN